MDITFDQLTDSGLCGDPPASDIVDDLNAAMARFGINTPQRAAAFLAQCAHESGRFLHVEENLNYSADALQRVWPNRFDADHAQLYAHQPQRIANRAYAGRNGNGDEASGDGWRFRGRGFIQLTGRENYRRLEIALGEHIVDNPDHVATPKYAALSAAWFWSYNGLNALADAGDIVAITKRINGGTLGLDERRKLYAAALAALS